MSSVGHKQLARSDNHRSRRSLHTAPSRRVEFVRPRVNPSDAGPKRVFVACHFCGFSPAEVPPDGRCPKCGKDTWERYALSKRLLPKNLLV